MPDFYLETLDLNDLREPAEPTRVMDKGRSEYHQLVASMKEVGLIMPIAVRERTNGKYEIVDGMYRYNAAMDLGWSEIACHIVNITDEQVHQMRLMSSQRHVPTRPIELTKAMLKILANHPQMKMSDMVRMLSCDNQWVINRLFLLKLAPTLLRLVESDEIPLASGYILSKLPALKQRKHKDAAREMQISVFIPMIQAEIRALAQERRDARVRSDK